MQKENLKEILELHEKWLNNEPDGVKANLSDTNLSGADLWNANLSYADLCGANLSGADLWGANLSHANLSDTNLSGADLSDADLSKADLWNANLNNADLCGANLSGADLSSADLYYANLSDTNLSGADLSDADLSKADLRYTDLSYADLSGANLGNIKINEGTIALLQACPEEGNFTAYKKASGKIVVLEVPADAKRSSATTLKCRCDKAKVLRIEELDGTLSDTKEVASDFDKDFIYKVGEIVSVDNFDDNRWTECSHGIHFFINKELARQY